MNRDVRSIHGHLLGTLPFDQVHELQQRLAYETAGEREARATLLLCEHPPLITIGRQGSRLHVRADDEELARRGLAVQWVNRGGGAIVHAPGQLALYAIVPLERFGLTVGAFLECWQRALEATAAEIHFTPVARPERLGLWGRGGQVAFVGTAVRRGASYFGGYLNVAPPERLLHLAASDPEGRDFHGQDSRGRGEPTSLAAEMRRPVRMPTVRRSWLERMSHALGCERFHLHTGHPNLPHYLSPAPGAVERD